MENYQQAYDFMFGLLTLFSKLLPIIGPFISLFFILRFLRWVFSSARGKDNFDDYQAEYTRIRGEYDRMGPRWRNRR